MSADKKDVYHIECPWAYIEFAKQIHRRASPYIDNPCLHRSRQGMGEVAFCPLGKMTEGAVLASAVAELSLLPQLPHFVYNCLQIPIFCDCIFQPGLVQCHRISGGVSMPSCLTELSFRKSPVGAAPLQKPSPLPLLSSRPSAASGGIWERRLLCRRFLRSVAFAPSVEMTQGKRSPRSLGRNDRDVQKPQPPADEHRLKTLDKKERKENE